LHVKYLACMKFSLQKEIIESKIYLIRLKRVMLDKDLAELYGVETRSLIQAVKRNIERFPNEFMFQLNKSETEKLMRSRSQFVILKRGQNIKYLPYAFTEQGVAMLSSVLKSKKAIQVNISIMKTFVKIREILTFNKELAYKLKELENRMDKQDEGIQAIFETIKQLIGESENPKRKIGFLT